MTGHGGRTDGGTEDKLAARAPGPPMGPRGHPKELEVCALAVGLLIPSDGAMPDRRTQPRTLFTAANLHRSVEVLLVGAVCGVVVLGAALMVLGHAAADQALRMTGVLVGWRVELLKNVPLWVAVFLSNAVAALIVMYVGPGGCALEMRLQERSPLYARLCRATGRPGSPLSFLDRRIRLLANSPGRDGLTIAYLVPMAFLFGNGFLIGTMLLVYCVRTDAGMAPFLASVAPHGVIEVPALCLAGSAALNSAEFLAETALAGRGIVQAAAARVRDRALTVSTVVVLALFLVAGYIEGNVTPRVMEAVTGSVPVAGGPSPDAEPQR